MDLSRPDIKKYLIFSQKKDFLIFWEMQLFKKNFLYFRRELSELGKLKKNSSEQISYISGNETFQP